MKNGAVTISIITTRNIFRILALSIFMSFILMACTNAGTAGQPSLPPTDSRLESDKRLLPYRYDGYDHRWVGPKKDLLRTQSLTDGNNDLSDQVYAKATNNWGPVEYNMSNGEYGINDGHPITLNGKTYTSGLGVHSTSEITYDLNGQCIGFQSDIGIDDEVLSLGSVVFQIWTDGAKVYDSGLMTGNMPAKFISIDVRDKRQLSLIVTNGGDDIDYDHADWAGATLLGCTVSIDSTHSPTEPYQSPLVISKGGVYRGNWKSEDPNMPVISIETEEPVIIEHSNLIGRGQIISGYRVRLTFRNNVVVGLNPNIVDRAGGLFLNLWQPLALRVENNNIDNTQGIYIAGFLGEAARGETIKILRNKFANINGLRSNGNEDYDLNRPNGFSHAVMFNAVRRVVDAEIAWNEIINEPGKSQVEENINMYESSGTPSSSILIHDNYIQGAYSAQPAVRRGYAGGGILVGDGPMPDPLDSGYAKVYNNQIVSTTNEGLAIAGGVENHIYNNRVISSGLLADGSRIMDQNVGTYVWDVYQARNYNPPTFADNSMVNNYIAWSRINEDGTVWTNPWWLPDCGTHGTICAGNISGGEATLQTESDEYQIWTNKLSSNNIKIGH